jgi:D-alanyl-D-alanine carboxypeptidase
MTTRILGIVVAVTCSFVGTSASASNLKPFDPVAFQHTVEATAKELMLPGAMVLLHTPQGNFAFGYGTTELGITTPPRADTYFRIASNTKTMTATVIVLLAQEGKLRFGDPVSKYVQGVPNGDDITISELLKMRSGLPSYTEAPALTESLDHDPTRTWTPEEMLAIAFKGPSLFTPDKEFNYCNTNYVLLGLIVEKVKARRWPKSFRIACSDPLA